jgi:hypothetical protein
MRSQSPSSRPRGTVNWDTSIATDFAITTINVPDRLDMQEVRARADLDEHHPRRSWGIDRYVLNLWMRRLLWLCVLGVIGYFGYQLLDPLRHSVSAAGLSEQLKQAVGRPVVVRDTEFRFTPTPRWVAKGVEISGGIPIDSLSLHFNWRDAWRAVQGGGWVWGEASISPMKLDPDQAMELLATMQKATGTLPATISTVRFEQIQFTDIPLLPGRYEVSLRRGVEGRFGPLVLSELAGDGNANMKLVVSAKTGDGGEPLVEFNLDALQWRLPFGPAVQWGEAVASGRARPNLIEVDRFSLTGFFGVTQGALVAAHDVEWAVTGIARTANMDIEAVLKHLRGKPAAGVEDEPRGKAAVPMNGTVNMNLVLGGRGDTLRQAMDQSVVSGPIEVRWAMLNGINLGYAAMHPGSSGLSGGVTRFSELDASLVAAASGISLGDIHARAGAMSTRGEIRIAPDSALTGELRVDLGGQRVQAPLNVRVRGTVLAPRFGR